MEKIIKLHSRGGIENYLKIRLNQLTLLLAYDIFGYWKSGAI